MDDPRYVDDPNVCSACGDVLLSSEVKEGYCRKHRVKDTNTLAELSVNVTTPVVVPLDRVAYTLCAALEGGSTYWCDRLVVDDYLGYEWAHEAIAAGTPFRIFHNDEEDKIDNSLSRIAVALTLLAERHPKHFSDLVNENEDADTGDVFFQMLCFAGIVYG